MIRRLVDDINIALNNNAYFAALSLALTLPDVCGKAEYPNDGTGKRYKKWYDEYVGKYEKCPCDNCKKSLMPYLSGEVVYSLRNSLLHQGTPNIDSSKIKDTSNVIDKFELIITNKNEFDVYMDTANVIEMDGYVERTYRVNIRRLCFILTSVAERYYENNENKFGFITYTIGNI